MCSPVRQNCIGEHAHHHAHHHADLLTASGPSRSASPVVAHHHRLGPTGDAGLRPVMVVDEPVCAAARRPPPRRRDPRHR
jgi:hypothetical protein